MYMYISVVVVNGFLNHCISNVPRACLLIFSPQKKINYINCGLLIIIPAPYVMNEIEIWKPSQNLKIEEKKCPSKKIKNAL